ncbi:hypothetical protein GCM10009422_25110 [Brevundimonas kwangchunensis]|uniref:Uncharacterized protein n=1 Tax=Brevundimonas kwangchunensis TaxID=322163 RepID=A0ABN1H2F9_9CAUL
MLKFALPATAALALIAVAAQSSATDQNDDTRVGGMGWHLSEEPGMAKLAYGVANSDQLALLMTCERGAAQTVVYGEVKPVGPQMVHASAMAPIDPLSGGLADEVSMSTTSASLQRLKTAGRLQVEGEAGQFELTATRSERQAIAAFFAYCGTGRV